MRFVIKALFFLAVVAAFIPRQPGAEAAAGSAVADAVTAPRQAAVRLDADAVDSALCGRRPALCDAARESAFAARLVADAALDHARIALLEKPPAEAPQDSEAAADGAETEEPAAP